MKRMRTALMAGLLAGCGFAAALPVDLFSQAAPNAARDTTPVTLRVMKEMIGQEIVSSDGANAGVIHDLAIDANHGRVAYVVIDHGRRGRLHALPFELLQSQSGKLTVNVTENKLNPSRGFAKDNWPDMSQADWARQVHRDYGVTPYWEMPSTRGQADPADNKGKAEDRQPVDRNPRDRNPNDRLPHKELRPQVRPGAAAQPADTTGPNFNRDENWINRASAMIGKPLKSNAGQNLGKVSDLVLDMRQGRGHIVYAVVSDTPDLKDTIALVPYSAIEAKPKSREFAVDASKDELRTASLKEADWQQTNDPQWHRRVHQAFKKDPYWTALGIPADEDKAFDANLDPVWQPGSDYMKSFDLRRTRRFVGKVTAASDFQAAQGVTGRQITLTDEDEREYTIHLGPASYFNKPDSKLSVEVGDQVIVRAARGIVNGKEVYLADQFAKTYELRDNLGRSLWHRVEAQNPQNKRRDDRRD